MSLTAAQYERKALDNALLVEALAEDIQTSDKAVWYGNCVCYFSRNRFCVISMQGSARFITAAGAACFMAFGATGLDTATGYKL